MRMLHKVETNKLYPQMESAVSILDKLVIQSSIQILPIL